MRAGDEIQRWRQKFDQIDKAMLDLKVEINAPDRVSLYQRAEVPHKREMKKQIAVTGVAALFGLGLIGGLITLGEVRRQRVFGPSDPLFKQALPLLGCLPEHGAPPAGADLSRLDGLDPATRAFLEAIDKVKAVLGRQMQSRKMQAILITSPSPDEGKSILAWNLALSLARTDKRTLFIDGNLRNPGLHNHFDIASHPGLSELVRGEKSMQEVVQRTALPNLWCVAAGVCDEAARHALDKERFRRMMDRARQEFDVVVIDCCSIREAVDPLYLAQRVDAAVLSVRTFRSRTADVERACHRLNQLGAPLLGAVLTDSSGAAAVEL
jgi:receptor protein-tyrosine kinase